MFVAVKKHLRETGQFTSKTLDFEMDPDVEKDTSDRVGEDPE